MLDKVYTLESGINIALRLLIFGKKFTLLVYSILLFYSILESSAKFEKQKQNIHSKFI